MNKEQQALDELRDLVHSELDGTRMLDEYLKHCDTLQKLVDKSTPKKPIKSNNPLFDYMVFCPACNKSMSFKNYYCGSCGQAVDWSGENDK